MRGRLGTYEVYEACETLEKLVGETHEDDEKVK